MTPASRWFCISLALACLSACGGSDTALPPVAPAQPPLARLWLPVLAAPSSALTFDASDSQSPGGELAHYLFDFGDGSPAVDQGSPSASHTYAAEGVYAVSLTVVDLSNQSATVQSQLTIRLAPPACTTDADCDPGERCQAVCFAEVGSAQAAARSTPRSTPRSTQ